ncbi:MAG TPA: hypothetical protein VF773_15910 [Verrucomicrobiae bacterium]
MNTLSLHYSAIQWQLGKDCTITLVWQNVGPRVNIVALLFDEPHKRVRQLEITPTLLPKLVARALLASTLLQMPDIPTGRP